LAHELWRGSLTQMPPPASAGPASDLFGAMPDAPPPLGRIARVQVETAAALELDYRIPERLAAQIRVGSRVTVPMQHQRVTAVVIELPEASEHAGRLKEIAGLVT